MMFWDSSAIVPLLVTQRWTALALDAYRQDSDMFVWWGTQVECDSAIARLERDNALGASAARRATQRLDALLKSAQEIQPVEPMRRLARRLLRTHPLRGADAVQLAAALIASEDQPDTLPWICFDDRLATAAEKEGFAVFEASSR